jgi:hypothetical protein
MPFCYFGKDLPKGYVELDGKNSWADAAWVPDSLRGKVISDTQDLLVGTTRLAEQVGQVWNSGKIDIGSITVSGVGLTLTQGSTTQFVLANPVHGQYTMLGGGGIAGTGALHAGEPISMLADLNNRGYSAKLASENTGIDGSVNAATSAVSLNSIQTSPQHIMCRLIVKT